MSAVATLNVRLPQTLKDHGSCVLKKLGVSTSEAVRLLFEYMEREGDLPECLEPATNVDKYEKRRDMLKSFAGCAAPLERDWTMEDVRDQRLSRLIDGRLS